MKEDKVVQTEKGRCPLLTTTRPLLDDFVEALDYWTYELRKNSQQFYGHVASNVAKVVKRLRSQLTETELDEEEPISILLFLSKFRDARNGVGVHKGVAL